HSDGKHRLMSRAVNESRQFFISDSWCLRRRICSWRSPEDRRANEEGLGGAGSRIRIDRNGKDVVEHDSRVVIQVPIHTDRKLRFLSALLRTIGKWEVRANEVGVGKARHQLPGARATGNGLSIPEANERRIHAHNAELAVFGEV